MTCSPTTNSFGTWRLTMGMSVTSTSSNSSPCPHPPSRNSPLSHWGWGHSTLPFTPTATSSNHLSYHVLSRCVLCLALMPFHFHLRAASLPRPNLVSPPIGSPNLPNSPSTSTSLLPSMHPRHPIGSPNATSSPTPTSRLFPTHFCFSPPIGSSFIRFLNCLVLIPPAFSLRSLSPSLPRQQVPPPTRTKTKTENQSNINGMVESRNRRFILVMITVMIPTVNNEVYIPPPSLYVIMTALVEASWRSFRL
jgi:hypothetical protein